MRRAMTIVGTLVIALGILAVPADASPARLRVTVSADEARARPGDLLSYFIRVRNQGRDAVSGATLTARLAGGSEVVGVSAAECDEPVHGRVVCALRRLPARGTAWVAITTLVRPSARGRLRTSVTVGGSSAAVVTPLRLGTDLAVRLRHVGRNARHRHGQTVAVSIVNRGPRTARHVRLQAAAITSRLVRYSGARCRLSGHRASCRLGRLAPGARRTVWLTTRGGPLAATVSPEAGDPHPADNTGYLS